MHALLLLTILNWMDDTFTLQNIHYKKLYCCFMNDITVVEAVNNSQLYLSSVQSLAIFLLVGISSFKISNSAKEV